MKNAQKIKQLKKTRRIQRIRARIFGTPQRPRLTVYRSLKHFYAQIIDDTVGKTLVSVTDFDLTSRKKTKKVDLAKEAGALIAKKANDKKIKKVIFDRRGYKYHGAVKAFADGAREGGLEF